MNVIKEELPNWQVRLTITIPALDVQKLKKDVIDDFSKQARLPGFRKGKVPPSLIESRYSKLIHEELTERLIEEFTSTAIQQTEFIPIDNLNVHNSQFSVNGDFHFVVNFYSFPIIPIPDYHNHTVTLPEFPITPDLVQNSINSILTQYADYQPVEDRPLQLDDFAVINLSTSLDSSSLNLPPHEIPNFLRPQQNLWLHITNSNTPVSQIAQNLIGLQPGQSKSFSLTFSPAQVPAPLSNQPITFTIELLAIQKRITPPLTDEIVKKISPNHTAESFRDHISQILQKKAKDYLYYLKLNK
ncbi:MAG: hypothetical protein NZL93_05790, partial [Chthoniobacterales bacterium]|nr:hypothetical protein [Chthoniobacterales bacterium]